MTRVTSAPHYVIPYCSYEFPAHTVPNGTNQLKVWPEDILWAAVTVGRANFMDVLAHGQYSEYELIYRISMVLANLARKSPNKLTKSPAFRHLDPSEKGAISYFLGLAMCKLFADKLLGFPWLLHYDVYGKMAGATGVAGTHQKPDLIGWNGRDWAVLESKGRTNGFSPDLLDGGKGQAETIASIGGRSPKWRIACMTHFTKGELQFDWKDPTILSDDAIDLPLDSINFLRQYYRLVYNVLNNNLEQTAESDGYRLYSFEHFGFTIGLRVEIFELLKNNLFQGVSPRDSSPVRRIEATPDQLFYFGSDGIAIGIDPTVRKQMES